MCQGPSLCSSLRGLSPFESLFLRLSLWYRVFEDRVPPEVPPTRTRLSQPPTRRLFILCLPQPHPLRSVLLVALVFRVSDLRSNTCQDTRVCPHKESEHVVTEWIEDSILVRPNLFHFPSPPSLSVILGTGTWVLLGSPPHRPSSSTFNESTVRTVSPFGRRVPPPPPSRWI